MGFGQTGREAVFPFFGSKRVDLCWVMKHSDELRGLYASSFHHLDYDKAPIFSECDWSEEFLIQNPVDVVVDFSNSSNVCKYDLLARHGIRIVSAVSKYSDEEVALLQQLSTQTAIIWSPNITLGINILLMASRFIQAATPEADIQILESHFKDKKEISGTAQRIADTLGVDHDNIHSIRAGGILGEHEIIFGYPYQTIRLSHDTISRRAFGRGALSCCRWIYKKKTGLFNMSDMLVEDMRDWLNGLEIA